jgi:hypothetical protein
MTDDIGRKKNYLLKNMGEYNLPDEDNLLKEPKFIARIPPPPHARRKNTYR